MQKTENSTKEVQLAADEFYEALQAVFFGDSTLMEKVWSHAEDVTFIGPQGGILKGWKQISSAWKEHANMKLQGKIEPKEMHVIREGNIGIVQNYEIGTNQAEGRSQNVQIRATNIFRKENGEWKMISHQTDLLPFLE